MVKKLHNEVKRGELVDLFPYITNCTLDAICGELGKGGEGREGKEGKEGREGRKEGKIGGKEVEEGREGEKKEGGMKVIEEWENGR